MLLTLSLKFYNDSMTVVPIIQFKNINLSFNKPIFTNFSLEVFFGEKHVITGKSGAGKSSLIKMLLGFLQPDSGDILFQGIKLDKTSVWPIRKQFAYVPQDLNVFNGNVFKAMYSSLGKDIPKNIVEKIDELFYQFGLSKNILEQNYEDLSGGEKQQILIIVSLLKGHRIFLLDEVTSAVDPTKKALVVDFFIRNPDLTLIVVAHDILWTKQKGIKLARLGE